MDNILTEEERIQAGQETAGYGITTESPSEAEIQERAVQNYHKDVETYSPEAQAAQQQAQQAATQEPNILSETAAALTGGAADAVESVGGFADLAGDTAKVGIDYLAQKAGFDGIFGTAENTSENPFSEDYQSGSWLDIPDDWVPENKTALGKLARGFVEFGLLTVGTGGIGGTALGGARLGVRGLAMARAAGVGARGSRHIKFLTKVAKVGAEGGIADLVSTSSEDGNMANLINEYAPWIPFSEMLAVDPEDNPWLARTKTVLAGAGVNLLGWRIASYAKGRWSARAKFKELRGEGKSIDDAIQGANEHGNQVDADEYTRLANESEEAATRTAAEAFAEGRGIPHSDPRTEYVYKYLDEDEAAEFADVSRRARDPDNPLDEFEAARLKELDDAADIRGAEADDVFDWEVGRSPSQAEQYANRTSHPQVNPTKHLDVEKADIVTSEPTSILRTSINDLKAGGTGRSWKHMWTSYSLKRMTGGQGRRLKILERTRDELVEKAFKNPDNTMSYKDLLALTDRHIADGLEIIMDGKDIANRFMKLLKDDPHNYRVFMTDGVEIKTITPAQKAAVQLNMAMLADTASAIARSGYEMVDNVPINTQFEQVMDATKALLVEHKRFGVMWGLDGVAQQLDQIPENLARQAKQRLAEIDENAEIYFSELDKLRKGARYDEMKSLMEIHAISGNKINTIEQVHDFLEASLGWGRKDINGVQVKGMREQQLLGTWYNSILSSIRTPIKAVASTNLIATLRPFQAYLGAFAEGNKNEMLIAGSMIDSLRKAYAEGMDMFWHNWEAGVHGHKQTYDIRYDLDQDMYQWKSIGEIIESTGTASQKRSYALLDGVASFNNNPLVRYSTNAMGAGDALARTVIGRMEMRHQAMRKALADGVDPDNALDVARATEENFRKSIFKEGKDGKWVVHDKAASMAGDEAAMTRNLQGVASVFDQINTIPLLRAFFPFARTGVNALNLTFEHIPILARTQRKFRDILSGDTQRVAQWGIKPQDIPNAQAMAEGRLLMGKSLMAMTALTTMTGNMTGDYPYDKERRDLWIANGIPPYSVRVGDTWVSYRNIEPFNTVAAIASNLVHNADTLGEGLVDEWQAKLSFMFSAVMIDKTMLSGIKELFAVFDDENASPGKVARVIANKLRPVVPYASLSKDIGNMLDGVKHEAQSLGELIIQNDAVLKSALHPRYDILSTNRSGKAFKTNHAEFQGGKGVVNPLMRIFNAISPVPVVAVQKVKINGRWVEDPVRKTLQDMRFNIGDIMRSYKGVRLSSKQRSRLAYYLSRGNLRKDLERELYNKKSRVHQGLREYKAGGFTEAQGFRLSDRDWYKIVADIFKRNKDVAMAELLREDPALYSAIRQMQTRRVEQNYNRMSLLQKAEPFIDGTAVPTR